MFLIFLVKITRDRHDGHLKHFGPICWHSGTAATHSFSPPSHWHFHSLSAVHQPFGPSGTQASLPHLFWQLATQMRRGGDRKAACMAVQWLAVGGGMAGASVPAWTEQEALEDEMACVWRWVEVPGSGVDEKKHVTAVLLHQQIRPKYTKCFVPISKNNWCFQYFALGTLKIDNCANEQCN